MKKCLIIITMLCLWGCGAIINPYKDDFSCPDYDKGKCIKVEGAYKESLQKKKNNTLNEKENKAACEKCRKEAKNNNVSDAKMQKRIMYRRYILHCLFHLRNKRVRK